jgi:hypothetical protein
MVDNIETELVEFKILLDSVWHNAAPKYEILLDDEVVSYGMVSEKSEKDEEKVVSFAKECIEGEHTLTIRLIGKLPKHTIVDENNTIIADQLLHIKQIEIDEIELDHLFYELGNFHKQIGIANSKPVYDESPMPEKYTNLGFNGEYRLKFSVPTYIWFLENL